MEWRLALCLALLTLLSTSSATPHRQSHRDKHVNGALGWMGSLQPFAKKAQVPLAQTRWLSNVQIAAKNLFVNQFTIGSANVSFTAPRSGCYQCVSGCNTDACKQCNQFVNSNVQPESFCDDQTKETSFRGDSSGFCSECTCCILLEREACDYTSGRCESNLGSTCDLHSNSLAQIVRNDANCARLVKSISQGNLRALCNNTCFESFMGIYRNAYNTHCIDEYTMDPDEFKVAACQDMCVPPPVCLQHAHEIEENILTDDVCQETIHELLTADSAGIDPELCRGVCFAKLRDAYRVLWEKNCFVCDESALGPKEWTEQLCPADAFNVLTPTVTDSNIAECHSQIEYLAIPLAESTTCNSLRPLLQEKTTASLVEACESQCFWMYMDSYDKLLASRCFVDSSALTTTHFEAIVCGTSKVLNSQEVYSPGHKFSVVTTTLSLDLPTTLSSFSANLRSKFILGIAHICELTPPDDNVVVSGLSETSTPFAGISLTLTITSPLQKGPSIVNLLSRSLATSEFLDLINDQLRTASEPVALAQVHVEHPPVLDVESPCDRLHRRVGDLCFGIEGCPADSASGECCAAIVDVADAGCQSLYKPCGFSMRRFFELQCVPLISDEIGNIVNWYSHHRTPSPSESFTSSTSFSTSPSRSNTPSPSPLSPSPTPSSSPVDVFAIANYQFDSKMELLGRFASPGRDTPYWGQRMYCDANNTCSCIYGYNGLHCEHHIFAQCPRQCSGHGRDCINGTCECEMGFSGALCTDVNGCAEHNFCNGRGVCQCTSTQCSCQCDHGLQGPDCSEARRDCPHNCLANGICNTFNNTCQCDAGFGSEDCSQLTVHCTYGCSGFGKCVANTATCACALGFKGEYCDQVDLVYVREDCRGCSGRGYCDPITGTCKCNPRFYGRYCESSRVPFNCADKAFCSGHGTCDHITGTCNCSHGYTGPSCNEVTGCPNHCSGNGKCMGPPSNSTCKCKMAWSGSDCSIPNCAMSVYAVPPSQQQTAGSSSNNSQLVMCSGRGICEKHNGVYMCTCDEYWTGALCNVTTRVEIVSHTPSPSPSRIAVFANMDPNAPCGGSKCSGQGECLSLLNMCVCFEGYTGPLCETKVNLETAVSASEFS